MTALQATAIAFVWLAGTAVALVRDPLRQVILAGFYGVTLTVLFVVFQAPDVALSELVVGSAAFPFFILLVLAKVRSRDRR